MIYRYIPSYPIISHPCPHSIPIKPLRWIDPIQASWRASSPEPRSHPRCGAPRHHLRNPWCRSRKCLGAFGALEGPEIVTWLNMAKKHGKNKKKHQENGGVPVWATPIQVNVVNRL